MKLYFIPTLFALLHLCSATGPYQPNWQQRNYNTIKAIYNTTIFPNNQAFLLHGSKAIPEGLFNANATGRITPVGNFSGFEDSVEYFFGLTPPVQAPLYDTWTKAEIVSFTSGCPEVASSVVYGTTTGVNPNATTYGKTIAKIKHVSFWRFDDNGAVIAYEAWLPALQRYTDLLYGRTVNASVEGAVVKDLCSKTQVLCQGGNQQYPSQMDCEMTLGSKPFGSWDDVWSDTVTCRTLHVMLAKIRPEAHCKHVGPTGGGKCVSSDYRQVYFDDQELFGMAEGTTFTCPSLVR